MNKLLLSLKVEWIVLLFIFSFSSKIEAATLTLTANTVVTNATDLSSYSDINTNNFALTLSFDGTLLPASITGGGTININGAVDIVHNFTLLNVNAIVKTGKSLSVGSYIQFSGGGSSFTVEDGATVTAIRIKGDNAEENNILINNNATVTLKEHLDLGAGSTVKVCGSLYVTNDVNSSYSLKLYGGTLDLCGDCSDSSDEGGLVSLVKEIQFDDHGIDSEVINCGNIDFEACKHIGASSSSADVCENDLPIELLFFNGQLKEDGVYFEWATASEFNSAYFEIQGSNDTKSWYIIHAKAAAGNSNNVIEYEFFDTSTKYKYYRLVQVDFDGSTTVFGPVSFNISTDFISKVYPTEINEIGTINILISGANTSEAVSVYLYSIIGNLVTSEIIQTNPTESFVDVFNVTSNINRGVYILRIINGKNSSTHKLRLN
ncbi:T9SS type A sorting domain-containing protein [Flammeovirga kamogawensis]|uniref:T9SS type A sorting domain-containing protein n=1 Tax=Flammeovirga kamogawensis TaxID=373891 RepID=A0ABX8H2S4_9BACT|nr:T9SS type A sorting domain-containing protein [Flammeovirga kamogawensis]MBB6460196.1 hypothetical protein [Flammeovirga kamogawensis]QWG10008.1 T9SS type A sorting domain-containing protein [Flammeovirga kamogawensis]TRX65516.1 T9SS type A sorting domain-containing protein [Flammeovirga kamogawensis]